MTGLEIIAVPITVLGIWLTARRILWCWPVNLLACILYAKVFWDVQLYANVALQALFALFLLYGWAMWLRGRADDGDVMVMPLGQKAALAGLGLAAIGAALVGLASSHYSDAPLPWPDAILSSFSLLAQYWTARRYAASWLVWIIVDIFYVALFITAALWLTAGLYAAMTIIAVMGYRRWRSLQHQG